MNERKILTRQEYAERESRLEYLKTVKRREIAENIRTARSFGDLSENSEYDEAKNQQGMLEQEIVDLEATLKDAVILDQSELTLDEIQVGLRVRILDMDYNEELDYRIVGSLGSSPSEGLVSYESPIGAALMGKKIGDITEVKTPGGIIKLKVLEISR